MITITPKALKQLKEIQSEDESLVFAAVRIAVVGGGCSGLSYSLDFDTDAPAKTDSVLEIDGIKVLIDAKSAPYLKDITLDYSDGLQGRGFEFKNPNARQTCGCGNSFNCG